MRADQASPRFDPFERAEPSAPGRGRDAGRKGPEQPGQIPPPESGDLTASPSRPAWRRLRRALALAAVVLVLLTAATARLFVWPARGVPGKVDAIVMLAGPGKLQPAALDLARQHRAPYLVISLGTPPSGNHCPRPVAGVKTICFNPVPATTQGEAEFFGRLAKRYHWRSVAVVTITSQDTRARLRVGRCFAGHVYVDTVPPDPSFTSWPYQIAYQWAALFKAVVLQRSC